jgi:drug/metabolite transporter (DMT)-like permease
MTSYSEQLGALAALSAGIIWGLLGLFVRELDAMGITPMQMTCMRYMIVLLAVFLFILFKGRSMFRTNWNSFAVFLVMGVVGTILNSVCYFSSMSMISLSLAAVLQYDAPFLVILLSVPILHEKLTKRKMIAVIGAFTGCVLCTGVLTAEGPFDLWGIFLGAFSGFCFCLYTIGSKVESSKGTPLPTILFYTSLICVVGLAPVCDLPTAIDMTIHDPTLLALIVGTGVFVTLLPFVLFNWSMEKIEAGKASVITYIEVVAATVVGLLYYNEAIGLESVAGILLILVSLILINTRSKTADADSKDEKQVE